MKIEFKNVVPNPLVNELFDNKGVWGNNLDFLSSDFTLIDAYSGKGKSTLTSFMAGLRFDYEGEILIEGKNIRLISKNEWSELRRLKLAFIFQDLQLFEKLTVKDNLLLKNELTDFKQEKEIKLILAELKLENKWDHFCGTLSLGQQQRIAIVRALLQPANFLIMDEPFSHLDKENTSLALNLIQSHCLKNKTGIVLTSLGDEYEIKWDKKVQIR